MSTIACPHCNGAITIAALPVGGPSPSPRPAASADLGACPTHRIPWTFKSGISKKTGEAYAFWSCNAPKDANGEYCRRKPDPRWTPPAPTSAPQSLDDGPF